MRKDDRYSRFERDMGRRKPAAHRGTPWIGTEMDRSGEATPAFPGTGSSLPQDIGADGFEVEPPPDEERDDLSMIDTDGEEVSPPDEFATADLDITPAMGGAESALMTADPDRRSRVSRPHEEETPLDRRGAGEMSESAGLGEMPIGGESLTAGEMGRYECPNCGFVYDVVVGTSARCPACQYEADLSTVIGDEAFHSSAGATELKE